MRRYFYIPLLALALFLGGCAAYAAFNSEPDEVPPDATIGVTSATTVRPNIVVVTENTTEVKTEAVTEDITETEAPVTTVTDAPETTAATEPPVFELPSTGLDTSPVSWADIRRGNAADPSKPMIALTFDDGPGGYTNRLLDILAQNNANATFFVAGYMLDGREATLQRIVADGHDIGGHSWTHTQLTTQSAADVANEFICTREKIYSATGVDTRLVRPPYGSHNEQVRSIAANFGIVLINWNIDTEDWRTRNADAVYEAVVNNARDGAIILCHDIHGSTVDGMERAIPKLIADGYQLVTVTELMSHSEKPFAAGTVYSSR